MSLNAYILAGGKSSRMGTDKGLMLFNEKPLIQYVIDAVQQVTTNIFIVTSNEAYAHFGFPLISDVKKGLGPAGAIDTILFHSVADTNLIIACDMPFIDADSIQYLIRQHQDKPITVPFYNQYPEALFALYDTCIYDTWHQLVQKGNLKLSDLLSSFETTFVNGNRMTESNRNLFKNMNTTDDLLDTQ